MNLLADQALYVKFYLCNSIADLDFQRYLGPSLYTNPYNYSISGKAK